MNTNQIFEDFDRKYQGSFVQVKFKNKDSELFQLNRITRDSGNKFPKLELKSDKLGTILLNYNTDAQIIFKIPTTTYIQLDKDIAYYTRRPERQWKRGINHSNTLIMHPRGLFSVRATGIPFNYNTVSKIFTPEYNTLAVALDKLKNKEFSGVVLNRNMALSKRHEKPHYTLFYRLCPIGLVDEKTGEITAPKFEKEIKNEIK